MIHVYSFSFLHTKKDSNPPHTLQYTFDCRPIKNPGKVAELWEQTGLDTDVQIYLETETEMPTYLEGVNKVLKIAVEEYLNKKDRYQDLYIYFGCTGGRHRSVYAAQTTATYIQQYLSEDVECKHLQLTNENKI